MSSAREHKGSLGLVAKTKRVISQGTFYDQFFQAPKQTDPILNSNGEVEDTVQLAKKIILNTLGQTKAIAKHLKRPTVEETTKLIFQFLYQNYNYKEDKPKVEQLRTPDRAYHDRKEGIDCDCFSITISSILVNANIPHYLRIVKMYGNDFYQHIYVVIPKFKGADMNKRSNYIVIDPVLDYFDYEAPRITYKKDYIMNGIPIQYLNGIGCDDKRKRGLMGFGDEFDGLGRFMYFGHGPNFPRQPHHQINAWQLYQDFLRRKKRHLINTRNIIAQYPHFIRPWYKPRVFLGMIDQLIGAWDQEDTRDAVLHKLSAIEHEGFTNGLAGLGELGGFFSKLKKIANGIKNGIVKGAKWVAEKAKQVAKVILKYNPLSIAARAGMRVGMKLNFGYLASKAYWGYYSEAEAKAKNVSSGYWKKSVQLKDKIEHFFADVLKGDAENIKNDILKGGSKRSAGGNLHGTDGLGFVMTAALTAAMAFLGPLAKYAKDLFGGDSEDSATPDDGTPAGDQGQDQQAPPSDDPGDQNPNAAPNYYGEGSGNQRRRQPTNPLPYGGSPGPFIPFIPEAPAMPPPPSPTEAETSNKKLLLYAGLAVAGILVFSSMNSNNPPPQPVPFMAPPAPAPTPPPAPQPIYIRSLAGTRKRATGKPKIKTIKLN